MNNKKQNNSYIKIESWMVTDLELKTVELILYALIYGFSKNNEYGFTGSIDYLRKWTKVKSKTTIIKSLNELLEKKLITKEITKIRGAYKTVSYKTTITKNELDTSSNIELDTSTQNDINNTNTDNTKRKKKENEKRNTYEDILVSLVKDDLVRKTLNEYVQTRILNKLLLTDTALQVLVDKLFKLSTDPAEQVKIVQQATIGCYRDFIPLKKTSNKRTKPYKYNDGAVMKKFSGETAKDENGNDIVY